MEYFQIIGIMRHITISSNKICAALKCTQYYIDGP